MHHPLTAESASNIFLTSRSDCHLHRPHTHWDRKLRGGLCMFSQQMNLSTIILYCHKTGMQQCQVPHVFAKAPGRCEWGRHLASWESGIITSHAQTQQHAKQIEPLISTYHSSRLSLSKASRRIALRERYRARERKREILPEILVARSSWIWLVEMRLGQGLQQGTNLQEQRFGHGTSHHALKRSHCSFCVPSQDIGKAW